MKKDFGKYICLLACLAFVACNQEISTIPKNFPQMSITTSEEYKEIDRTDVSCAVTIKSKDFYYKESGAEIHLHGNSTALRPKRPFLLKLRKEPALYGMPSAKSWVLLSNYVDKTMLRVALAFRLAEDCHFTWTPHYTFVDITFNGEPKGVYQLIEKVQVHPNRLCLPEDGWLVEVDAYTTEEDIHFYTEHMEKPFHVHYPKEMSPRIAEIETLFTQADSVLFSDDFADPDKGWRRYLDVESWIEWYVVNEICKNCDAVFYSSGFMHSTADGKIAMGPLWDMDIAFGNTVANGSDSPEGWYVRTSPWYSRLFEDPAFKAAVDKRLDEFYARRETYFQFIREKAIIMKPYADANEEIWHTYGELVGRSPIICNSYEEAVDGLIEWLDTRFKWMNENQ